MSYYTINSPLFKREDFEEVTADNIFDLMVDPEEIFLGEVLSTIEDPIGFLETLVSKIEPYTMIYIQENDAWECFDHLLFDQNLEEANNALINFGKRRFMDLTFAKALCKEVGLVSVTEDIEAVSFILSVRKA